MLNKFRSALALLAILALSIPAMATPPDPEVFDPGVNVGALVEDGAIELGTVLVIVVGVIFGFFIVRAAVAAGGRALRGA